jgi:hypothetical protein
MDLNNFVILSVVTVRECGSVTKSKDPFQYAQPTALQGVSTTLDFKNDYSN